MATKRHTSKASQRTGTFDQKINNNNKQKSKAIGRKVKAPFLRKNRA